MLTASILVLSAVPITAGALRLMQLAGGPQLMPADQRISEAPAPVVVHVTASIAYLLLGIVQFLPSIRRRHPLWHRRAGRAVVVAGVLVAGSALWMTLFYAAKAGTGSLLFVSRLVFGVGMAVFLLLGVVAIRARDVRSHQAWMIRAYAVGLAAGTQTLTEGLSIAIFGAGTLQGDLGKLAGWIINLAVAEWVIRRLPRRASRS